MSTASHVLVVEDEPKLAAALRDYLLAAGFHVSVLHRGDAVLPWLDAHRTDAVLLDLMLPGMDGLEICRSIRRDRDLPILMLTARSEDIDRLLGLELGADDYLCKPYNLREVVLRVRAVLRRATAQPGAHPALPFTLDADRFVVRRDSRSVELTATECRLLAKLCERPGRILSRAQLVTAVYGDDHDVSERAIDSHVKNLRRKLESLELAVIDAVYGAGFRLDV
ncbi:MAG: response regulator [Xanthomonadales bacterium]|nr:response regulator [Xanthomonadales bacterium]